MRTAKKKRSQNDEGRGVPIRRSVDDISGSLLKACRQFTRSQFKDLYVNRPWLFHRLVDPSTVYMTERGRQP